MFKVLKQAYNQTTPSDSDNLSSCAWGVATSLGDPIVCSTAPRGTSRGLPREPPSHPRLEGPRQEGRRFPRGELSTRPRACPPAACGGATPHPAAGGRGWSKLWKCWLLTTRQPEWRPLSLHHQKDAAILRLILLHLRSHHAGTFALAHTTSAPRQSVTVDHYFVPDFL